MAKMAKYQYGKTGIILIWQRGEYIIMANNTLYQYGQNGIHSFWIKWQNTNKAIMTSIKKWQS